MYNLEVKLLNCKAKLPTYATEGDAGLDLFSTDNAVIKNGEAKLINTGIAICLPQNTEAQIRPRSGLALNHKITVLNTPGTIDEGYRGEIGVILINHGVNDFEVKEGMKIAQIIIKPTYKCEIIQVEKIESSKRGNRGFGSSGNK